MDWKKENVKNRYIDDITDEEAYIIANLALGDPNSWFEADMFEDKSSNKNMELISVHKECNGNNIPHVKILVKYFCNILLEETEGEVGIFYDLNVYNNFKNFRSTYCQKEIFEYFKEIGLE